MEFHETFNRSKEQMKFDIQGELSRLKKKKKPGKLNW